MGDSESGIKTFAKALEPQLLENREAIVRAIWDHGEGISVRSIVSWYPFIPHWFECLQWGFSARRCFVSAQREEAF